MHNATMSPKSTTSRSETSHPPIYPMPLVRVDVVCLSVADGQLKVLLAQRAEGPFKSCWGLPGGVLRIDLDESLESAARRIGQERMQLGLGQLDQVVTVGGADRDPRAQWAMTVVYRSLVGGDFAPEAGKRVEAFRWFALSELTRASADGQIAFDHHALVMQAVGGLRADVQAMRFAASWFPEPFTVSELQSFAEVVLDERFDKVTFRRRLDTHNVLKPLLGQMRTGPFRPAQLYELA